MVSGLPFWCLEVCFGGSEYVYVYTYTNMRTYPFIKSLGFMIIWVLGFICGLWGYGRTELSQVWEVGG